MPAKSAALFLDRDGTLIVHKPYLHRPEEVELLPGVSVSLRLLRATDFRFFLLTNQSGVGRGWFSLADVDLVHQRMLELMGLGADLFAGICVAPETPDQPARYRKPSPLFIQEQIAAHNLDPAGCWMIGDTPSDWHAGLSAGINAIAVRSDLTTPETEMERAALGVSLCADLSEAVQVIMQNHIARQL